MGYQTAGSNPRDSQVRRNPASRYRRVESSMVGLLACKAALGEGAEWPQCLHARMEPIPRFTAIGDVSSAEYKS